MNRSPQRPKKLRALVPKEASLDAPGLRAIARYMTESPHSIGRDQAIEAAHAMMRRLGVRHLPVLDGGKLAGVLSQRDLYFVEAIAGGSPKSLRVEEAMSQDTYCVPPTARIDEVAREMAEQRYGCAVVMEGAVVRGIFTTTDALRALSALLEG